MTIRVRLLDVRRITDFATHHLVPLPQIDTIQGQIR
jgi:hypothetical protein